MCDIGPHDVIDFLNSLSTIVIAAFTALMYFIVRNQLHTTKITDRAWLVHNMETPSPYQPNQTALYVATIRNTGNTPAWVTAMGSHGQVVELGAELPEMPSYDMAGPFPDTGTPLAPGGLMEQPFTVAATKLGEIEQGKLTLYLFGTVLYHDIFGEKHETRYCYQFKPAVGKTDPRLRDFYIGGSKNYNKAT